MNNSKFNDAQREMNRNYSNNRQSDNSHRQSSNPFSHNRQKEKEYIPVNPSTLPHFKPVD